MKEFTEEIVMNLVFLIVFLVLSFGMGAVVETYSIWIETKIHPPRVIVGGYKEAENFARPISLPQVQ